MPDLLDRRKKDLEDQLEVLPNELKHWKALSDANQPFEKHHSQIEALSRQMTALNDQVKADWGRSASFVAIQKAQRDCGGVHAVWNYFREKFLMRADPHLGGYLRAADAYVWACYEPVLRQWREAHNEAPLREPPLVAFDTDRSPWALSRRGKYTPLGDTTGATGTSLFADTLAHMPIAILGIPWNTMELLPNLAVLAHETGHIVDSDFGQDDDPVGKALAAATSGSRVRQGWSEYWRKEVFADLFGCYAAGPPFVWVLADSIPDSPESVTTKRRPTLDDQWGVYPPATLRMLLNIEALRHLGYKEEATRLEQYWKGDYAAHAMSDVEADVRAVVPAFYAAAGLPAGLNFAKQVTSATQAQRTLVNGSDLKMTDRFDPRALVGVASDLHRTPPAGIDPGVMWGRLQDHIVSSRPPGVLDARPRREAATAAAPLRTKEIASLLFVPAEDDEG
ncbi:MAG: hypothetical protein ABIX28_16660 [Vicinamibacterales bacterium]